MSSAFRYDINPVRRTILIHISKEIVIIIFIILNRTLGLGGGVEYHVL